MCMKEVKPSEKLAYWIGVAQSDGHFKKYLVKSRNYEDLSLSLGVGRNSLPMIQKFQELSSKIFNRHSKIWKENKREIWDYHIGIKKLLNIFSQLGIIFNGLFIPPKWTMNNPDFFGAYLGGIIDGDGDIRIKRKKYPQCIVRITSGFKQDLLKTYVKKFLNCSVSETKRSKRSYLAKYNLHFFGSWFAFEFLISKKNLEFVFNRIVPHINLTYKKQKILDFIKTRYAPSGI